MNKSILSRHLWELAHFYRVQCDNNLEWLLLKDYTVPPGYNWQLIDILSEIPPDYPESPLGVGDSRVYVPSGLKFHGRTPPDYHEGIGPKGWAWWCYESIDWDPCRDNLITFFEIVRAHMTNPR